MADVSKNASGYQLCGHFKLISWLANRAEQENPVNDRYEARESKNPGNNLIPGEGIIKPAA
jgi:hypothetical protein